MGYLPSSNIERKSIMRKRLFLAVPAAAAVLTLAAGPAMAHQCYIASRSWQGNLMAGTKSQAWFMVDLNQEFAHDETLTPAQRTCLTTELTENGVPLQFTIHVKGANGSGGVLSDNNPNTWLVSNGKGVDHFFAVHGAALQTSFATCNVPFEI